MELLRCVVLILALAACHSDAVESERGGRSVQQKQQRYQNITKIIGGQKTTVPIPYQVSLQLLVNTKWRHFCGGSIITKSHVLTAAHCLDKLRPERIFVLAGTSTFKAGGVRHNVVAYKKHSQYSDKGYLLNDVAIIKVTPPFQLNQKTIGTISLAENSGVRIENNYPVTLTGWGSISPTNKAATPDDLMILNYTTIPNSDCRRRGYKVTPNEICTFIGRNRGACVGDSGGPLVNRERNIQIGVVSYGSPICASGTPDVYSRVPNFLPWIRKVVQTDLP